ncbi:MAG: AI-2E family transporter [Deltaproteobacteria bacterium]|nr:AI-2E family transporter [Deltaproteobacteria bacterium]
MKTTEISREKKSLIIVMLALLVGFLYVMGPFLRPMILASIIVVIFYPLYSKIVSACKGRRKVASLVSTLLIFSLLIVPSSWITTILIQDLYNYIGNLNLKETFSNFFTTEFYSLYVLPVVNQIETQYQTKINILGVLTNFGKQVGAYIYDYSPTVLLGTFNFIFAFFVMIAGIYFLFLEGESLTKVFLDVSPLRETHERRLIKKLRDTINASIYGYIVTGLVQGFVAAVIFALIGLDAFVLLGTLTFFMSMVPIVGSAGVWGPVAVWLFLQGQSWEAAVVFVSGAGGISMMDNFLKPILIEGQIKIHPLLIFFSLFGGIQLFGPLGILFGPVISALLVATINIYREEFV